MKKVILFYLLILVSLNFAQQPVQGVFQAPKPGFIDTIEAQSDKFISKQKVKKQTLRVDMSKCEYPKTASEFKSQWHNSPVSQGLTGMCWCFSTTSFFESECYRINKKKIKISELYTVYCEYVEKAKEFVRTRGESHIGEGSEADAVIRIWKEYGCMPISAYSGLKPNQPFHDHRAMFNEIKNYLENVKRNVAWDEEVVVSNIKAILNHYIGCPKNEFDYDGKTYNPKTFFSNVIKLNLEDYISVISLNEKPFYTKMEYQVEDNWWHGAEYHNLSLSEFYSILRNAIQNGFTASIGGDVSEPGHDPWCKVGVIPEYDIPSDKINDDAREFRFDNQTTQDDHGMHLVGFTQKGGKDWFLIKDSGAGARNVGDKGYYYFNDDYIKLKMVDYLIHKDAIPKEILSKFK